MKNIPDKHKRVCAVVDLDAAVENMEHMREKLSPETRMLAVIKANGYGHGAVQVARKLDGLNYVFGYAVATVEEALQLRRNGLYKPILILGYTFPDCYKELVAQDIRPAVFRTDMAKELSGEALRQGKVLKIHIKVDTGMSRIGISPDDAGLDFIRQVMELPGLEIEGIFTHFARADEADKSSAMGQFVRFGAFTERIRAELSLDIPLKHCANSAAIMELPETRMDLVRAGIALYGLWPSEEMDRSRISLRPLFRLYSHIVYVKTVPAGTPVSYGGTYVTKKKQRIATIPVGYGDGYPRGLSGKGDVLIRGRRAPVLGRVCMDQFMVDVTDIPEAKEGDLVTLIGRDGKEEITMEELGDISGRFNYELACDLGSRIPRVYMNR
ncbi:MAG: alanine racemase [Lachnospiraceae bacterium]|nr:alanine racemase [Lachnospiraceae bacterium]